MVLVWILTLAIIAGQLIRIPLGTHGGVNLLDITVISLCLLGVFQIKFHLKKPPLFIAAAIFFILVALISLIFTPLYLTSTEYLTSLFYTVRFSLYIFLGWLLLSGAIPSLRENINKVLLFSGIALTILGLLQFIFLPDLEFLTGAGWDPHYFRTVSTFLDPNFAGGYFVLTLILLLSHKKTHLPTTVGFLVITYVALLTTFSRSSYLMFLISGLSLSFLEKSKKLAVYAVMLFIILLLGFQIYSQLVAQPRGISRQQSASFRINTWEQGLSIFQKYPILGVGFNAYRYAIKEFNLGDEQFLKSHGSSSNDSSLLYIAATTGIVGLSIYLLFIISLLKYAYPANIILIAAQIGLLGHSLFANSLFYPPILLWLILKAADTKV